MQTIITAWEVVKYSPASDKYPTSYVQDHIKPKEFGFAKDCLGLGFYQKLLNDLKRYGKLAEWDNTTIYSKDHLVTYYGAIIKSETDNNGVDPCKGSNWTIADKFAAPCYNDFWAAVLRPYLAFIIMGESIDYATYQISAKGVVELFNEASGEKTASKSSFLNMKNKLLSDAAERLDYLKYYIECNKSSCDFSQVKFLQDCQNNCTTNPGQSRRMAWKY